MGVAEEIKELGRPRDPLLNKRGVFMLGNTRVFTLGVRIIVAGAALGRVLGEGEGGKTNKVWDGVGRGTGGLGGVLREGSNAGAEMRGSVLVWVLWGGSDFITPGLMGDEGTVGRIDKGGGRRRPFRVRRALGSGGTSKVAWVADCGTRGNLKVEIGPEGGLRWIGGRAVWGVNGSLLLSSSHCESGEVASLSRLSLSNPPPTLSNSSSSASSTRSSLRMLPLVRLLAIDPVRLLPP